MAGHHAWWRLWGGILASRDLLPTRGGASDMQHCPARGDPEEGGHRPHLLPLL